MLHTTALMWLPMLADGYDLLHSPARNGRSWQASAPAPHDWIVYSRFR
jgi:hypothetical protein